MYISETISMPTTILADPADFGFLFRLWAIIDQGDRDVNLDFTGCHFLKPNAVAFLGGLSRLAESRSCRVRFLWDTFKPRVLHNLQQNGFAFQFGQETGPWQGNSVPYREDNVVKPEEYLYYLLHDWLGRGWVNVSDRLRNAIAGRVYEIYMNAFEHSCSPIGVFTCGHNFPSQRVLQLSLVDFGVGIPSTVRMFKRKDDLAAKTALEWAFRPGTTTKPKPDYSRGNGLDLLKDFIVKNNGSLEVYSHDAYTCITSEGERYLDWSCFFEGTVFNITLKCDERVYVLASEVDAGPLF